MSVDNTSELKFNGSRKFIRRKFVTSKKFNLGPTILLLDN